MDVIVDLDGTVADLTHRLHWVKSKPNNWPAFFAGASRDKPIMPVIEMVKALWSVGGNRIIFCSGRPESTRADTRTWLERHVIDVRGCRTEIMPPLYMRPNKDYRPDHVVKLELLAKMRADGYDPQLAIDDRSQVVQAWRSAGILCAQVADGNY